MMDDNVKYKIELAGKQSGAMQGLEGHTKICCKSSRKLLLKVTIKHYALKRPEWQENGESTVGRPQ